MKIPIGVVYPTLKFPRVRYVSQNETQECIFVYTNAQLAQRMYVSTLWTISMNVDANVLMVDEWQVCACVRSECRLRVIIHVKVLTCELNKHIDGSAWICGCMLSVIWWVYDAVQDVEMVFYQHMIVVQDRLDVPSNYGQIRRQALETVGWCRGVTYS